MSQKPGRKQPLMQVADRHSGTELDDLTRLTRGAGLSPSKYRDYEKRARINRSRDYLVVSSEKPTLPRLKFLENGSDE